MTVRTCPAPVHRDRAELPSVGTEAGQLRCSVIAHDSRPDGDFISPPGPSEGDSVRLDSRPAKPKVKEHFNETLY